MTRRRSAGHPLRVVMVANFALSYNRKLARGARAAIEDVGDVYFYHCDHLQSDLVFRSREPRFDAVLLGACLPALRLPEVFRQSNIPAVDTSGEIYPPPLPRVITDDLQVGRNAAEYFIERGFDRHIFVGYQDFHWSDLRLEGFREVLSLRQKINARTEVAVIKYADSTSWNLSSVMDNLAQRLAGNSSASIGIFCANDTLASGVVESCGHRGIEVPEQAAVLGVDDDDLYTLLRKPYISSMRLQTERIGHEAMRILLSLARDRARWKKSQPHITLVPPDKIISRRSTDTVAVEDQLLRACIIYIREHLHEGLNVKELTRVLGVSRTTLETRFKSGIGRLPGDEIRRQRMTRACDLLASTQMPIGAIARRVGFGSAQLFSEAFRRFNGMTPLKYRQAQLRRNFG